MEIYKKTYLKKPIENKTYPTIKKNMLLYVFLTGKHFKNINKTYPSLKNMSLCIIFEKNKRPNWSKSEQQKSKFDVLKASAFPVLFAREREVLSVVSLPA